VLQGGRMYSASGYDAHERRSQVSRGQQTKSFGYDSLGRLSQQKRAVQEGALNDNGQWVGSGQWSGVFFYDTRSNLARRVDARGVQTRYDFNDPLNRLLSVQYDKSGVPAHLSPSNADAPKQS